MGERYTIVGWSWGTFTTQDGRTMPYANLYVVSPVNQQQSETYHAVGYKAEKLSCVSPAVWESASLEINCDALLVFNKQGKVTYAQKIAEGCNAD